jgi:hypothetical protein
VQEEKRWFVFRAGFSVKNGETIYLYRAKNSWVFHEAFLFLGLG